MSRVTVTGSRREAWLSDQGPGDSQCADRVDGHD